MSNALHLIQEWIDNSPWKITIIPRVDDKDNAETLLGISEYSTLGTIVNHVGGISAANSVIRHFGGTNGFDLSIKTVNHLSCNLPRAFKGVLVVADDIYGGLFGINESLPLALPGTMIYLPPDTYDWESLEIGHSAFVNWTMSGDVPLFYKSYKNVPVEANVPFDKVLDYQPPLWARDVKTGNFNYTLTKSSRMHQIRAQLLEQLS